MIGPTKRKRRSARRFFTSSATMSGRGGLERSMIQMKVMDALRAPGPNQLAEVSRVYNIAEFPHLLSSAVESASLATVQWVVEHVYRRAHRSVNETDGHGNTPLHIAVIRGRRDVAVYLLNLPETDDTITNTRGLVAADLVSDSRMEVALSHAQDQFSTQTAVRLKNAFQARDIAELEHIYSNPRISELLNINGTDPDTGLTALHEASSEGNLRLVRFILDHGGDPLVQDTRGRLPSDLAHDETVVRTLNSAAKSRAILQQTGGGGNPAAGAAAEAPAMAGFLKKWTNLTSGYKLRWFVLRNGTLSYFRRRDDANSERLVRGTMALRHALVRLDSSEKNKFEVRTANVRFHLKAAHPAETNRWVWTLQNAITHAKDVDKAQQRQKRQHERSRSVSANSTGTSGTATGATAPQLAPTSTHERKGSIPSIEGQNGMFVNDLAATNEDEEDDDIASSSDELADEEEEENAPSVSADLMVARLTAVKELLVLLVPKATEPALAEAITTAQNSLDVLEQDIKTFAERAKARDARKAALLERADKAERQWARNYRDLELNYERLDGQLHALTKADDGESDDEFFDAPGMPGEDGDYEPSNNAHVSGAEAKAAEPEHQSTEHQASETNGTNARSTEGAAVGGAAGASGGGMFFGIHQGAPGQGSDQNAGASSASQQPSQLSQPPEEEKPSDKKDSAQESDDGYTKPQTTVVSRLNEEKSWAGYENPPRQRLKIDADNRPRMSLWGILKNLIGRDMTRMTLPVTFNECTSLLQRSAEDMEYTDLLDKAAAAVNDPGLRLAYVVAFAASSYSSTINRVAKPFNPLLGETYEYARPDKGYRLMAEQVSHHPPIGALMAESRHWDFYGESNVDSKFYGRSFDINPLGLWYLNLRPDNGSGTDEELYSFRKVTSSVVGIMVGNPVVDNHGEMHVTNHTLGLSATVNFKPRGWRGSSAYKLNGVVKDKQGNELWSVGGTWNDKIWAKRGDEKPVLLWQVHERKPAPFNLTQFAITLNDLSDNLKPWLPPTDTRLRPDQRAMEEGRYDDASNEKARVEDKQRKARRIRESTGTPYEPKWFKIETHPVTGKEYYKPVNNYWAQRRDHELANSGDIF